MVWSAFVPACKFLSAASFLSIVLMLAQRYWEGLSMRSF